MLVSNPCCRAHSGVSQSGAGRKVLRGRGRIGRSAVGAEGEVSRSARVGTVVLVSTERLGLRLVIGVGGLLIPCLDLRLACCAFSTSSLLV